MDIMKYGEWDAVDIVYLEWVKDRIEDETGRREGNWAALPKRQMEALYVRLKFRHPQTDYQKYLEKEGEQNG